MKLYTILLLLIAATANAATYGTASRSVLSSATSYGPWNSVTWQPVINTVGRVKSLSVASSAAQPMAIGITNVGGASESEVVAMIMPSNGLGGGTVTPVTMTYSVDIPAGKRISLRSYGTVSTGEVIINALYQ